MSDQKIIFSDMCRSPEQRAELDTLRQHVASLTEELDRLKAKMSSLAETWQISADNCRRQGDDVRARLLDECAKLLKETQGD